MTYYRLAIQHQQTATWAWKSTVVTSLQALFQLLRIYRVLPQDRLRVFSSTCKEDLAETVLNCENSSLTPYSVTAAAFLHARKLQIHEMVQSAPNRRTTETVVQPSITVASVWSWAANSRATYSPGANDFNMLEKQRLETELGPGGDHDLPYTFVLPPSLAQIRVWIKLLAQVQSGELQP